MGIFRIKVFLFLLCFMVLDLQADNQRPSGKNPEKQKGPSGKNPGKPSRQGLLTPGIADPNPSAPPPPPGENNNNDRGSFQTPIRPSNPPSNKFREFTENDPGMPSASEATLTIDLRKGTSLAEEKNPELARLKAVVFTLNSLNKANRRLLKVEDILKENFGKAEIPKTGDAKIKINLSGILFQAQNSLLRNILPDDPMVCGSNFSARGREVENGISADTLVRQVYNPENYNGLMVDSDRARFDRSLGVIPEFDSAPGQLDRSDNTLRILLAPEDSGIAHKGCERKLVLQKTNYGGLLIRSEDIEKQNASRVSFALNPVSAKGDGHEGIWQLPNGLFAFELRNRGGIPQTSAPVTMVRPSITNPLKCLDCHSSGYIATTGGNATEKSIDKLRRMEVLNEDGFGKSLYKATFQQYQKEIEIANKRLKQALETSGVENFSIFSFYGKLNEGGFSVEELAKEFSVSEDTLVNALLGDPRFGNALNLPRWKEAQKKKTPFPRLTRQELERQVDAGGGRRPSLFCALKERLVDSEARLPRGRGNGRVGGDDATVHDSKQNRPIFQPNRDEKL